MNSNLVQTLLVGVLSVFIAALLVAIGFLGRVVIEGDPETIEVPATAAAPATPTVEAEDPPDPSGTTPDDDPLVNIESSLLDEIIDILEREFVEPDLVDRQLLYEGAINGLFQALGDPHSVYIDPQTYAVSRGDFDGAFEGIGATVSRQDNYVVIVRPLPDTPAERAGVRAGDIILAVDGEDAEGWSVEKAVLRIRGQRGTSVDITVRHTDGTEETITIVRDNILVASIDTAPPGGILKDSAGDEVTNIGYIRIRSFTSRTPQELADLVRELEDSGEIDAFILDVRANPGGLLDETAQTADLFLDDGAILVSVDRTGTEQVYRADRNIVTRLPIAVIQDEFSASGSEVLAAAIQENGRGIVVGSTSFGKGTVNRARDLSNGGAVYVSIARWLTPDRNIIEGRGVIPDIEVTLTADDIEADRDLAVYRAIDALRAMLASSAQGS
ncbi:MAG: S41 family peptidase [Chloroflexota bacterium]|nr:S41 family peptidase [Chloroflexota bacterium]